MTGIAEIIVALWFLPVTLFIIIPLVMFAVWHLGLGWACRTSPIRYILVKQGESAAKQNVLSTA